MKKYADYMRLSADQGNVEAMYRYGECLENGKGVPKNLKNASMYYEHAGDYGHEKAKESYLRLNP